MNDTNNVIIMKKKYNRNTLTILVYYIFLFVTFLLGFYTDLFNDNRSLSNTFFWYDIQLVDYKYEASKWSDYKYISNGYYFINFMLLTLGFLILTYLPIFVSEIKRKKLNNSNLYIDNNCIKGTYDSLFGIREFEVKIDDIKNCKISKNIFYFILGKSKLTIYTTNKKLNFYFLEDIENVKVIVDNLAHENEVNYEEISSKEYIINKIKKIFTKKKNSFEYKLEELDRLKKENKINDNEYEILRRRIINQYK